MAADRGFRDLALALPQAFEVDHFGAPSFRVDGKIFAQLSGDGVTGPVKLPLGIQAWLLAEYPESAVSEPSWGRFGWTRFRWQSLGEAVVIDLLRSSWRAVAPRKLHPLIVLTEPEKRLDALDRDPKSGT